jgi:hypothetical protein
MNSKTLFVSKSKHGKVSLKVVQALTTSGEVVYTIFDGVSTVVLTSPEAFKVSGIIYGDEIDSRP